MQHNCSIATHCNIALPEYEFYNVGCIKEALSINEHFNATQLEKFHIVFQPVFAHLHGSLHILYIFAINQLDRGKNKKHILYIFTINQLNWDKNKKA